MLRTYRFEDVIGTGIDFENNIGRVFRVIYDTPPIEDVDCLVDWLSLWNESTYKRHNLANLAVKYRLTKNEFYFLLYLVSCINVSSNYVINPKTENLATIRDISDDLQITEEFATRLIDSLYQKHIVSRISAGTDTHFILRSDVFNSGEEQSRTFLELALSYDLYFLDDFRESPEYLQWRRKCLKRDGHMCRACNVKDNELHVHHILNYSSHFYLRVDVDNGAVLCASCHTEFHKKFGYRNNNRNQFDEFVSYKQSAIAVGV